MARTFEALSEAERVEHLTAVARRAVTRWGAPETATLTLLNISENATFRVDAAAQDEPTILRVHRTGYHSLDGIRTELAWMKALQEEAGVQTPQAISALDGTLIQTIATPAMDEERFVVMFAFIEGEEPDESDLLGPFERLGAIAAKMHVHARTWKRPDYFERLVWDFDRSLGRNPNWGDWRDGLALDGERIALFQEVSDIIEARLARFGSGPDRFGLIHADLRLANLLEQGNETRVIDFDDAGLGWFLYDFATAVSFMEDRDDIPALIDAWVRGYRTIAPLSKEEEAEIPTFMMLRRLLIVAWVGSHSETDLARELGEAATVDTVPLARSYIEAFGA